MREGAQDPSAALVVEAGALADLPELQRVRELLAERDHASLGNLWGGAQALVVAALAKRPQLARDSVLVLTSTEGEAEAFADDLGAFGLASRRFPARGRRGARGPAADVDAVRARLQVAQALAGPPEGRPRVLVASTLALLQPIPSARELEKDFLAFRVGDVLDAERLLARLVNRGYSRQPLAEAPGEASLRGDILDLFPFAADVPLRVELFEDEIESLRTFEPADQRSIESLQSVEVCLTADAGGVRDGEGSQLLELCPSDALVCEVEPLRLEERTESLRIQSPSHERALRAFTKARARHRTLRLQSLPGDDLSLDTRSVAELEVGMRQAHAALARTAVEGTRVVVLCLNAAEEHRLRETFSKGGVPAGVELRLGMVSRGFRVPPWDLVVVNHHELKGVLGARRRARPRIAHKVRAIQSFFELRQGDLVVHAVHGLARYAGLERVKRGGGQEEHLHLVFADDVSLFVPSSRVDMVQRYIGPGASGLPLDRIGGTTFRRRKERVERGLFDMAAELIEVQAKRSLRKRPPWAGDDELVRDLVESFPHEDTADQTSVDAELVADLCGERPMDRMICGDVGFGKTELALRAAFRVVNGGGQVALLVPTTVLAQQHYETFSERLADFPVEVAVMSRYVTGKAVREVIERSAAGQVDVLVGTHRILSADVSFRNLGLVIIDEEQRFGVQHKEHFKKLRSEVDVLTMTATPIPRTLHMSMSGLRDISALTIAPAGRLGIETIVGYGDDDELMREAILSERNRGGQVFFLHNRVATIDALADRLHQLVPEAVYAVGHGQMGARELRTVMSAFTRGDVDVLVATTIIENGLDIPAAGTILIDDADQFGLSELHQLRGRVGRGAQKATCYLLVERHKPLKDVARERLKALEEMSQLGAGFGISIKDLELRGAGNVLGAEQSGHIAAVGYDMYCRLLRKTIEHLQAGESFDREAPRVEETEAGVELELGLAAYLPEEWIASADARLAMLRELVHVADEEDAREKEAALRDRFGRVPEPARALLRTFALKARLDPHQLTRLAWRGDFYLVQYADRVAFERFFAGLDVELRRISSGVAHLVLPPGIDTPEVGLEWVEGLLKRVEDAAKMPVAERP